MKYTDTTLSHLFSSSNGHVMNFSGTRYDRFLDYLTTLFQL